MSVFTRRDLTWLSQDRGADTGTCDALWSPRRSWALDKSHLTPYGASSAEPSCDSHYGPSRSTTRSYLGCRKTECAVIDHRSVACTTSSPLSLRQARSNR
jgi:hypothetical protein